MDQVNHPFPFDIGSQLSKPQPPYHTYLISLLSKPIFSSLSYWAEAHSLPFSLSPLYIFLYRVHVHITSNPIFLFFLSFVFLSLTWYQSEDRKDLRVSQRRRRPQAPPSSPATPPPSASACPAVVLPSCGLRPDRHALPSVAPCPAAAIGISCDRASCCHHQPQPSRPAIVRPTAGRRALLPAADLLSSLWSSPCMRPACAQPSRPAADRRALPLRRALPSRRVLPSCVLLPSSCLAQPSCPAQPVPCRRVLLPAIAPCRRAACTLPSCCLRPAIAPCCRPSHPAQSSRPAKPAFRRIALLPSPCCHR